MVIDLPVNRLLRMWRFSVSHRELVLMSTKDDVENQTRFFVLLKPAKFISLPTAFECSRIRSVAFGDTTKFEFIEDRAIHHVIADHFFHGEDHELWRAPIPFGVIQSMI